MKFFVSYVIVEKNNTFNYGNVIAVDENMFNEDIIQATQKQLTEMFNAQKVIILNIIKL